MGIMNTVRNKLYDQWRERTGQKEVPTWVKVVGVGGTLLIGVPIAAVVGREILKRVNTPIDELIGSREDVVPFDEPGVDRDDDSVAIASEGSFPASDPPNWRG